MQPAARVSAAIEILDTVLAGTALERALTHWGRNNRYAGSKDRRAIRDLCYQAIRCKRSYAALGHGMTGRGLMLGACFDQGLDAEALFDGSRFAPAPLAEAERLPGQISGRAAALDCPDWMLPVIQQSLGDEADHALRLLRERAPITLRVNISRGEVPAALEALGAEGIEAEPVNHIEGALIVRNNKNKINSSHAFLQGLVELQDASSQAAILSLGDLRGLNVLDYCAGGGGKALALADRGARVVASDVATARMVDLPQRAKRAGVEIQIVAQPDLSQTQRYDLVFVDAPCSGSGTWRRTPEAKWALTEERLDAFSDLQLEILTQAQHFCNGQGRLVYATCSMFQQENENVVKTFLQAHTGWRVRQQTRIAISEAQDGFFFTIFERD